jgi:hypothetical protein
MVVQGLKGVKGVSVPLKSLVYKEIDPLPRAMLLFDAATPPVNP